MIENITGITSAELNLIFDFIPAVISILVV